MVPSLQVLITVFTYWNFRTSMYMCVLPFQTDTAAILADIRKHASGDGLTTEEYLMWTVNNPLPMDFLNLLFQVSVYTCYFKTAVAITLFMQ